MELLLLAEILILAGRGAASDNASAGFDHPVVFCRVSA
jgi:hypothetical protein